MIKLDSYSYLYRDVAMGCVHHSAANGITAPFQPFAQHPGQSCATIFRPVP